MYIHHSVEEDEEIELWSFFKPSRIWEG
jgi:hypothetical protein